MSSRSMCARAALLTTALFAVGCPESPYVKATDAFGQSVSTGLEGFTPVFGTAVDLCYRNVEVKHLQDHLTYNPVHGWNTPPRLGTLLLMSVAPSSMDPTDKEDLAKLQAIRQKCESLAQADSLLQQGLVALGAYAKAITKVGKKTTFDSTRMKEAMTGAGDLAIKLSKNQEKTKTYTDMIVPIGQITGEFASVVTQLIVEAKLKESIQKMHPAMLVVFKAARGYVELTRYQAAELGATTRDMLTEGVDFAIASSSSSGAAPTAPVSPVAPASTADSKTSGAKGKEPATAPDASKDATPKAPQAETPRAVQKSVPPPYDVLAVYGYLQKERKKLDALEKTLDAYEGVVDDLEKAASDLKECADGKMDDDVALNRVLTIMLEVATRVETLKSLTSKKE